MASISGLVERITFRNEETGFSVLQVRVRGQRNLATVVGKLPVVYQGESIEGTGEWKNDRTHGVQFDATELKTNQPQDRSGLERYLASGVIKGVGAHLAKQLVDKFGTEVIGVIEKTPEKLRSVSGIGPKRIAGISESWKQQRGIRDLMIFLHSHGIGTARAATIYRTYGSDALTMISQNPYRLADEIRGIGFLSADALAQRLGIDPASLSRARAAVTYLLGEARGAGHCALPREELVRQAVDTLSIPQASTESAIDEEIAERRVIADSIEDVSVLYLSRLWHAERRIVHELRRLEGAPPWPVIDTAKAIPWVEAKSGIHLAPSQADALARVLRSKRSVLTGGPGVGKTTLMNSLIRIVRAKGVDVALCAPTGRAAKRLSESTSLPAKTIHRLLEIDAKNGSFRKNESEPLECDLLVVDESSMIDVPLMEALLRAVPDHAAVLFVGDVDQLPSVGPGQVLSDLIDSESLLVVRLTEVFRQAAESRIIVNAHRVNQGEMPLLEQSDDSDFYFVKVPDPDKGLQSLLRIVEERIPKRFSLDARRDVQILSPMNKGSLGVRSLNDHLQKLLNPSPRESMERFGVRYGLGDKVMQTENDYDNDVFNGDIGWITGIDREEETVSIDFDGRRVEYRFSDMDTVVLAYATTIHKSQGSEYPAVVIPLVNQHFVMLQRNLLYTAITRARKLVVLIGQESAIRSAVENRRGGRRWSKLKELLAG